jgi:hypothetical protein
MAPDNKLMVRIDVTEKTPAELVAIKKALQRVINRIDKELVTRFENGK